MKRSAISKCTEITLKKRIIEAVECANHANNSSQSNRHDVG